MDIAGSKVLVTGATGGLGHAIARRLAADGAKLVLTGRKAEILEDLARELGAEIVACDLADRAATAQLALDHTDTDILVNNAALSSSGDVFDYSTAEIDKVLEVNLRAPIQLARDIGAAMIERRRGHIVFISSLSGKTSTPKTAMYSAAKFGLRGFGQGLRHDLEPHNVGVSVIFPGFVRDAGMFANSGATLPRGTGTSSPEEVSSGVVRAVTRNKGEVVVAPVAMKVATAFAGLFPAITHSITKRAGSRTAEQMAAAQRTHRT